MQITMERDLCQNILPACEECFATFVLHGCIPDRRASHTWWRMVAGNYTCPAI